MGLNVAMASACKSRGEESNIILFHGRKSKTRIIPRFCSLLQEENLLLNNVVQITAALLSGFSRRAKAFEMVLAGRFLVGIAAVGVPTGPC